MSSFTRPFAIVGGAAVLALVLGCGGDGEGGAGTTASGSGSGGAGGGGACPALEGGLVCATETVEAEGVSGNTSSLALDAQGVAHIAYSRGIGNTLDLRYATEESASWQIETVVVGGSVPSLAVEATGIAHIAFGDYDAVDAPYTVKHATNASGTWVLEPIDSPIQFGDVLSIALDQGGGAHVSYTREAGGFGNDVMYATNATGAWVVTTIDTGQNAHSSIAVDAAGGAHIAYHQFDGAETSFIKYATNASGAWTIETVDTHELINTYTTIAVDTDAKAHLGYRAGFGDLFHATNASGAWVLELFNASGNGNSPEIALDADQRPELAYYGTTPCGYGANLARKPSGSWQVQPIALFEEGQSPLEPRLSLVVDAEGRRRVSYHEDGVQDLKLATCD